MTMPKALCTVHVSSDCNHEKRARDGHFKIVMNECYLREKTVET